MLKTTGKRILTLVTAVLATGAVMAAPADAAEGQRHFVRFSTHNSPVWHSWAELYDGAGNQVHTWNSGTKRGGHELWYWTYYGDNGSIDMKVRGSTAYGYSNSWANHQPLDRDYCFLIKANGETLYTGDSLTGGCTPD